MVVNKRGKNVKEMLCKAKLPQKQTKIRTRSSAADKRAGFKRCAKPRCPMCPFTGDAADGKRVIREIKVKSSDTILPLKHDMNCQTKNCIYMLTCLKDGQQYVGQTGRTVAKRFAEHRDSMHQAITSKPVGLHFQEPGHRGEADATMLPIIKSKSDNIWIRKAMERRFINDHDMIDSGLNKYLYSDYRKFNNV